VGRIGDPAQRKWCALRASACRRAAYTFSPYTVRAGLDHGTYTNVSVSKSGSCGYVEVMLKVTGRDLADFFSVFFLSPDAINLRCCVGTRVKVRVDLILYLSG